ncbi:MAG: IgGFc-binding protein, partial [Myxococcales bacterium]|nr:IgGFc-binding protein [Myxococcales bacterium]
MRTKLVLSPLTVSLSLGLLGCPSPDTGSGDEYDGVGLTTTGPDSESSDESGSSSSDDATTGPTTTSDSSDSSSSDSNSSSESADGGLKFDLTPVPDGGMGTGGEMGIPEDCNTAAAIASSVGCLFFGLDLDNQGSAGDMQQYGIIVSNVQTDQPAMATVESKQNGVWMQVQSQVIQPLDSYAFQLPDNHQEDTGIKTDLGTYRVTTDVPVVAYQFNPLDGSASYTTDASLLYPVPSWDYLHEIVGYKVTISAVSYIDIVAAVDGTAVQVVPSGPTLGGGGIPAGQANTPFFIMLDEGDVAHITSTTSANATMTGTRVITDEDHPVGVFTATECTNTGQGACDHMEEMITGVRLWGMEFVASRMPIRQDNSPEPVIWQIYASEDDTVVTITASPEVTGLPASPIAMNKGDMVEFSATGSVANPGDFFVEADKPIAVMSYL